MKRVYKYDIGLYDFTEITMPKGSEVLCVKLQYGKPQLWALVNTDEKRMEERTFRLAGTGHGIREDSLLYVGTVVMENDSLVLHLFEIPKE